MRKLVAAISVAGFVVACSDSSGPNVGPPAALLILSGGTQVGLFGQPLSVRPTVLVVDENNLPVPDISVSFATGPGATIDASTQKTSSKGSASVAWTMGNAFGQRTLTATVQGLDPVTFSASALAPDAGILAFNITDPVGDTLPAVPFTFRSAIDLVGLRGDFKRDSLIVTATFSGPVSAGDLAANSVLGYLEFDIDDNRSTGEGSISNAYGATANVGIEYWLGLFSQTGTTVTLFGLLSDTTVAATYSGNTIVVRVPMRKLGNDDGNFTVVGVIGTFERATDFFPNAGQTQIRRSLVTAGSSRSVLTESARLLRPSPKSVIWGPSPRL